MYFDPSFAFMSVFTILLPIAAVAALVCLCIALIAAAGTLRAHTRAKRAATDLLLAEAGAGTAPGTSAPTE